MPFAASKAPLPNLYATESGRIRQAFESSGNGLEALLQRSTLVDQVVKELYRIHISTEPTAPDDLCLLALGGYGREELFPHSDIDLLFVSHNDETLRRFQSAIAAVVRSLWDLGLRASEVCRTMEECGMLHRDNLEFNVALIDLRHLAGAAKLFEELRGVSIPRMVRKNGKTLLNELIEASRTRHRKYSNTIFHLEPNLKEAPGGLRDFHVSRWLGVIAELESRQRWASPQDLWPFWDSEQEEQAFQFLCATRCFLHYQQGRDDNRLTYELQQKAADAGIGGHARNPVDAEAWMRMYFRHARTIDRLTDEMTEEAQPGKLALYDLYRDWKSRLSNLDFSVVRGKIVLRLPAGARDAAYLMRLFEFVARHGLELSRDAERGVEETLAAGAAEIQDIPDFWRHFCQILALPHAAQALRGMHRLGWLETLFPEFRAIDSLVIRDFYHRYTVDEHTFLTLDTLNALPRAEGEWHRKFSEILSELEAPHLLVFSLLFHDVGKGMATEKHIEGSLEAVGRIFTRLSATKEEQETICFLIRNHLEMSTAFLRRDIFDPATIHRLTEIVGSPGSLKMLCLLTYADIKSVNPEALSPWRAEMLWRLYAAASNALMRNLDSDRIHLVRPEHGQHEPLPSLEADGMIPEHLNGFLEGFPKRYPHTHTLEDIRLHHRMAEGLRANSVQTLLRNRGHHWELTVMTHDRPHLFASLTGTLAAWGMNIVTADAFANKAEIVLDTFRFVDLFRVLDLNPGEQKRLRQTVVDVLRGAQPLEDLLRGRVGTPSAGRAKVRVPTQILFDDTASWHSTLLELITQDRPGLLYQVSSLLAELGCNIEVALIETQGQKAIDVFYLSADGKRLDAERKQALHDGLLAAL